MRAEQNAADRGYIGKDLVLLAKFTKERIREKLPAPVGQFIHASSPSSFAEEQQLLWFLHGKVSEEDRVKQTKNCRVCTNPQRECDHRYRGEPQALAQPPQAKVKVLK